jgi:chromosome segregation ATPase
MVLLNVGLTSFGLFFGNCGSSKTNQSLCFPEKKSLFPKKTTSLPQEMMAQHQQLSGNHQHVQNELSALLQHNHTDHSHTHQQQQQVHDLTLQVTQLTNQSHAWKEESQALHNDHHHQKELVRRLRHQVEVHREENDGLVAAVARVEAREEQVRAQLSENVVVLAVAVRKREDAMVVVQEQRLVRAVFFCFFCFFRPMYRPIG